MRAWTAVDDDELALIASDDLDPRKARVVQRPFQEY
jgi:hypothetical protein